MTVVGQLHTRTISAATSGWVPLLHPKLGSWALSALPRHVSALPAESIWWQWNNLRFPPIKTCQRGMGGSPAQWCSTVIV